MSPERPPSQDSGGGGGCGGSISVVTKTFDSTNMVLSTIPPIESGHMIIQQHQQQQHQQQQHHRITATTNTHQITNGINNYTQLHGHSPTSIITKPVISPTNGSPSKYVFLQQNGNGQHIGSESGTTTTTTTYITGSQTNNVGNIVLVTTTESMEINSAGEQISSHNGNGTDEELTSLTWLQDKNLIKGIVACTNKSAAASPARQSSNSGALSPTSDFLEDSCVSEDNASSANSNSDQGISIHNAEYSPNGQNGTSFVVHRHHLQTNQFSQAQNNSSPIQYTNNNNSISKNRNLILSSPSTHTALTSQAGSGAAASTNGGNTFLTNATVPDHLVGATTTVHVGPSGTTTVVEYKAGSNFISSPRNHCIPQVPSSPRRTPPVMNSVLVTSPTISAPPTPPPISNSSSTSAHQHFHKKYIREQLNGCEQTTIQNGVGQYFSSNNLNNTIAPFSPNHSISSFPADSKEFIHSTPMKQQTTPLYTTINGHEPVIKEESSFEYPSEKVQSIQKPITSPKQKHPTNVPYNPLVHTHNKPPYSFSSLIFMAIEDSPEKALPVKEIYAWIVQHFPYYKTAPTGWKNSVRHNLSLNKSFLKVEKAPNMGKGSLWRVEHSQRPNLIQALTRSPFFPGSVVDKIAPLKSVTTTPQPFESPPSTPTKSTLDARLFPKLSKMIKEMVTKGTDHDIETDSSEMYKVSYSTNGNVTVNGSNLNGNDCVNNGGAGGGSGGGSDDVDGGTPHYDNIERLTRDCGADSIDDVNAATAMLALKHGPKVFNETFPNGSPVITSSPSEDHTYSAGGGGGGGGGGSSTNSGGRSQNGSDINSNGASSDAAYESSEENPIHEITPQEIEERRRHIEGVDALLSFASKVSSMSSSGTSSPVKRPAVDDDHISSYKESNSNSLTNSASEDDNINIHRQQQQLLFTPQGFYSSSHVLSAPSPAKKLKTPRNLRNKIKRKSAWIR